MQAAEEAWNTRDPARVAAACTPDTVWRNRSEVLTGREQVEQFLKRTWEREHLDCGREAGADPRLTAPAWHVPSVSSPRTGVSRVPA